MWLNGKIIIVIFDNGNYDTISCDRKCMVNTPTYCFDYRLSQPNSFSSLWSATVYIASYPGHLVLHGDMTFVFLVALR